MSTHVVIIGAYGSAGSAVAERLVDAPDVRLTLIDHGDPGGGLCILRGCMPSKEVISASAHRFQARHDNRLTDALPAVDLDRVVETKNQHVERFASHRREAIHALSDREHVEFIHDRAKFIDDRRVQVGDRVIDADYVVIATGSVVHIPAIPGIDEVDFMTSADVLDATSFSDSGIVIGFGFVGLELVPYLSEAAGMDVTVIEHDARPLDEADPRFGDELLQIYREEFDIEVLTHTAERAISTTEDGRVSLSVDRQGARESIVADQLFVFAGRRPNLAELGLEHTSIARGPAWVDETMQARDDPRVFVVGDVNEKEPILHVAKEQGITAAHNILAHRAGDALELYEPIHLHVVFSALSVYPYVRVGHTATSADEAGLETVSVTRRANEDGIFTTKTVPAGLARIVVDAHDGAVLGYQGLHHDAEVMAKTMQVVIELGLDVRALPDRAYHPTTPELLDGLFREVRAALE